MREIDATEAKGALGVLLDLVEQGEEVVITRQGRATARLVPPSPPPANRSAALDAASQTRVMSAGVTLGGSTIKDLVNEGRR